MLQEEILSIALAAEAEGFASAVWERLAGLLMRRWSKLSKRLEQVGTLTYSFMTCFTNHKSWSAQCTLDVFFMGSAPGLC